MQNAKLLSRFFSLSSKYTQNWYHHIFLKNVYTPKNVTYKQKWSKGNRWQLDYLEIEQALEVQAAWPKWSVYDR